MCLFARQIRASFSVVIASVVSILRTQVFPLRRIPRRAADAALGALFKIELLCL